MRPKLDISLLSFMRRPENSSFFRAAPAPESPRCSPRLDAAAFPIYEEPGRQVVKEQLYIGGDALPWGNWSLFVELTFSRSIYHIVTAARRDRLSFFDRGIVDQVSGLERRGLSVPEHLAAAVDRFRYHETVFMMPPWPEIFSNDDERKHSFEDALASYEAQLRTYERFGYQIIFVPKLDVSARADFVLSQLREGQ
jgi:predicted ATPase